MESVGCTYRAFKPEQLSEADRWGGGTKEECWLCLMWMISNRSTTNTAIYRGDLCLAGIAECIKKSYANFGYCYRIGGDEFCVLLKNSGNEGRCKQEFFAETARKTRGDCILPTVSYGSAPFSGEDIVKLKTELTRICINIKRT